MINQKNMDIETINIPAYQRKRSLAAKSRHAKKRTQKISTTRKVRPTITPIPSSRPQPLPSQQELQPKFTHSIPLKETPTQELREMKICGKCEGYFDNIEVAIIKITSAVRTGDSIIFEKDGGLFEQTIDSMQINRKDVSLARAGSDIGLKVKMRPKVGTNVYKVL